MMHHIQLIVKKMINDSKLGYRKHVMDEFEFENNSPYIPKEKQEVLDISYDEALKMLRAEIGE